MIRRVCPQCGSEYRQGFTRCNNCEVELVWEIPRGTHDEVDLVKVFETGNPALVPLVESLLADAKIECIVKNKRKFDLFGANPMLGPVQFFVRDDEAEEARALLAEQGE